MPMFIRAGFSALTAWQRRLIDSIAVLVSVIILQSVSGCNMLVPPKSDGTSKQSLDSAAVPPARQDHGKDNIINALLGQDSPPEYLFVYCDTTPSTLGSDPASARWNDLSSKVVAFEDDASPGSKWEIYVTDGEGRLPGLLDGSTVQRLLPRDRRQRRAVLLSQLRRDGDQVALRRGDSAAQKPSPEKQSPIIEDAYRLYQRAAALGGPSRLIVYTDCQELSPLLRWGRIAAASDPKAYEALLREATTAFPKLPNPPEEIDIFYLPGGAEQGHLSGAGTVRLQRFFADVVSSWGSKPVVTEPRETTPATPESDVHERKN